MPASLQSAQLKGAWELVDWRIDYSDGRDPTLPFGAGATGLLVYTEDGFMSAGISTGGRPGFGGGSVRRASAAQRAAAFDTHFHYQGTYRLEGDYVIHCVREALNPDFVGGEQRRRASFENGTLVLAAEDTLPGTEVHRRHRLRWRRPAP